MSLEHVKTVVLSVKESLAQAVFPWRCAGCDKLSQRTVCEVCITKFGPAKGKCCVCQTPSPFGLTHPKCQSRYSLDGVLSSFDYHEGNLNKCIVQGKYYFTPQIFAELGQKMGEWMKTNFVPEFWEGAVFTYIPLHRKRENWRGFNQSEILAKEIAKTFNAPYERLLVRLKNTAIQKDLAKEEREVNMQSAFACKTQVGNWYDFLFQINTRENVRPQGKKILIVDDVATTGATLLSAGRVLKQAGAKQVFGLTLARD